MNELFPVHRATIEIKWIWEMRNLAPILDENWDPPDGYLNNGMTVKLVPPPDARNDFVLFANWNDVARYLAEITAEPSRSTPAIREKALELTAGKATELEKVRALSESAQGLNYVSIGTDFGKGGGYTPHPAETVLNCGYGDCKDKTTLLRALLEATGGTGEPLHPGNGGGTAPLFRSDGRERGLRGPARIPPGNQGAGQYPNRDRSRGLESVGS